MISPWKMVTCHCHVWLLEGTLPEELGLSRQGCLINLQTRKQRLCFLQEATWTVHFHPLSSTFHLWISRQLYNNDCLETWQQEQFPCPVSNSESQNLGIWLRQISPNLIALSSTISACEKGGEWQMALELFASAHMAPWKNGQFNIFQHSALLQLELFY